MFSDLNLFTTTPQKYQIGVINTIPEGTANDHFLPFESCFPHLHQFFKLLEG
jgi:hypothetical protein